LQPSNFCKLQMAAGADTPRVKTEIPSGAHTPPKGGQEPAPTTDLTKDDKPHGKPQDGSHEEALASLEHHAELDDEAEAGPMANAPFVNKVWLIVNNPANHQYIRWVPGGRSIIIVDREGFEKQLLPYYFKHKQFTSFVRQLNMYGWHKVQDLSAGTMQSNEEHWQFANPNFIQGQPQLLKDIVRNKGHRPSARQAQNQGRQAVANSSNSEPANAENQSGLQAILKELEQIRSRQHTIGEDLGRMRKDNELLWNEYYQTRERYDKHSQVLGRILRFLATIYGNQSKILDLNDPMSEIMMQGTGATSHAQHHLNLLPPSQKPHFDSGIHDLREIEQLQHQIEEASPGSMNGGTPDSYSRPSVVSNSDYNRNPGNLFNNNYVPQASEPSSRRVSIAPYWEPSQPGPPTNQLVRATPNRAANVRPPSQMTTRTPTPRGASLPPAIAAEPEERGHVSPIPSPELHDTQNMGQNMDDPAQLFPELGDIGQSSMPPLTSQELEQISREVASTGSSLQNIQDWLARQNMDGEDQFNVDDFLNNGESAPQTPVPDDKERKNSNALNEPDKKRVRVN